MSNILILEDDAFLAQAIGEIFQELRMNSLSFCNVLAIEDRLRGKAPKALIVDMAIPLGGSTLISNQAARGGFHSGQAVLRYAKRRWKRTPMALMTGKPSEEIRKWCISAGVEYFIKPVERNSFERFVGIRKPHAFVVHGRNTKAISVVKSALRALKIRPVVLQECASRGRTVIEKFEEVSSSCDCAIVIASPDDIGRLASSTIDTNQYRTRQNVLFELGYFYGILGRRSGTVVLVEYGDVEIPSDLAGIVRLDGDVTAAQFLKALKIELKHLLA